MNDYDHRWYERYRNYLKEKYVRKAHNEMFDMLHTLSISFKECDYGRINVIDLGCATQEFYNYYKPYNYFGIDSKYIDKEFDNGYYGESSDRIGMIGNYTELDLSEVCPFIPTVFVSLFSTEIFMGPDTKYQFYERIFRENPSIEIGMVAGVYYRGKEGCYTVNENDEFIIWQTIEDQKNFRSRKFDEFRTYIDVPSETFGPYVVEVWKWFIRRK